MAWRSRDRGRLDEQQPGHHALHVLQLDVERLVQQHRALDPFGAQVQVADVAVVGEIDFGQGGCGSLSLRPIIAIGAISPAATRRPPAKAPASARPASRCRGSRRPAPPARCRAARASTCAMRGNSPGSLRPCGCAAGALLGRAVEPVRRNVGRIGFQHQRRQRQLGGQPPDLLRALEGHGAAKAQLEAELDELVGLLRGCR